MGRDKKGGMERQEWEGRDGNAGMGWEGRDGKEGMRREGTGWEGNMIYVNVREKINNF